MFAGDWLVSTLNGPIKGIGRQGIASINNFVAYYIIDLPVAYYLAFHYGAHISNEDKTFGQEVDGIGQRGLWIGVSIALFYNAIC